MRYLEVKQSELEEIGIVKGHALKIVVNIKKEEQKMRKKSVIQNKSKVESTLDESAIKKFQEKPKQKEVQLAQIS